MSDLTVFGDVRREMERAEQKHGPVNKHGDVPIPFVRASNTGNAAYLERCARLSLTGPDTADTFSIIAEELGEAARARTPEELYEELIQLAATAIRMAEILVTDMAKEQAAAAEYMQRLHGHMHAKAQALAGLRYEENDGRLDSSVLDDEPVILL